VKGSCERGNETSDSVKCWDVLEQLHNCRLLKEGPAPRTSTNRGINVLQKCRISMLVLLMNFALYSQND
jgi:hypothetical protein